VLAYGDHILTMQPHPEIEAGFMSYLLRLRGTHLSPAELDAAIAELDDPQRRATRRRLDRGGSARHARQTRHVAPRDGRRMTSVSDLRSKLPEVAQLYLEGRPIDEVECIVADLAGVARGKAMPGSKFASQSHFYLPNSIFFQTITGDWAEVMDDGYTEPDMVLTPDYSTASPAPWTADWTLQVIHDISLQDGTPVPFAPRNVLKRIVNALRSAAGSPSSRPRWSSTSSRPTPTPRARSSPPWAARAGAPPRGRPIP
jgi:hypothetical protein